MSGKNHRRICRGDFVEFLHEHCTLCFQAFDNEPVVHDLMADIDGCAVGFQRQFDDLDGPVDACAKSPW